MPSISKLIDAAVVLSIIKANISALLWLNILDIWKVGGDVAETVQALVESN